MAKNPFGLVKLQKPGSSVFNLTHEKQLTMPIGALIPIFRKCVNPNDHFYIHSEFSMRFMPMIAPVLGRMNCDIHYFYDRNTTLWAKFYEFMEGVDNLGKEFQRLNPFSVTFYDYIWMLIEYYQPKFGSDPGGWPHVVIHNLTFITFASTILDYLGYPVEFEFNIVEKIKNGEIMPGDKHWVNQKYINLFPLFHYHKIYYEYYSKENLERNDFAYVLDIISMMSLQFDDFSVGYHTYLDDFRSYLQTQMDWSYFTFVSWLFEPHYRKYANDYFTSANPWTQKGQAPKVPVTASLDSFDASIELNATPTTTPIPAEFALNADETKMELTGVNFQPDPANLRVNIDPRQTHQLAGYFNISDLRIASAVQRLLEKFATAGTRINEYLKSVFGVDAPSLETGRAVYLGGTSTPIQISTVYQNSETATTPLGEMAGRSLTGGVSAKINYYSKYHGTILGIMSVRPRMIYNNVIERELMYFDRFDYPTPDLQHVGEQAIDNLELFPVDTPNSGTFGYQQRYGEAKYIPNTKHGEIKDGHSLCYWSSINRVSDMNLGSLVNVNPEDYSMMFNYQGLSPDDLRNQLVVNILNKVDAKRPLSFYSTPSL